MKKYIYSFLFCMLPILGHGGELVNFRETYISEFIKHCEDMQTADMAWREGDLEEAWRIYCALSKSIRNPLFQSGILLKKILLAHELGLEEEEIKENTMIFIKSFILESGLEINENDLERNIESAKNILVKNAEKFKQLFFAMYDTLTEE